MLRDLMLAAAVVGDRGRTPGGVLQLVAGFTTRRPHLNSAAFSLVWNPRSASFSRLRCSLKSAVVVIIIADMGDKELSIDTVGGAFNGPGNK